MAKEGARPVLVLRSQEQHIVASYRSSTAQQQAVVSRCSSLRARYAVPGTIVLYAATSRRDVRY
eukprot:3940404-Rhodomonas_salina.3